VRRLGAEAREDRIASGGSDVRTRLGILLLISSVSGVFPQAVPLSATDDRDGDGVVDVIDNCTARANPEQVDSDGDAIGDACDADYDQNGTVDASDQAQLVRYMGRSEREPGFDPRYDHDGDGVIGTKDLKILLAAKGEPPGPYADDDGDGVAVADDWCPEGQPGRPTIGHGCSLFDVVARPRTFLEPLREDTEKLSGELEGVERLDSSDATPAIDRVVATLDAVLERTAEADFCGAQRLGATADAEFEAASAAIEQAKLEMIRLGPPIEVKDESEERPSATAFDDFTEWDGEVEAFDSWTRRVGRQRQAHAQAMGLLETACTEASGFTGLTGRVRRMDWSQRRVELADGRVFALAEGFRLKPAPGSSYGHLFEDADATFDGYFADEGAGVFVEGGPSSVPSEQPGSPGDAACLQFRIAPFQRFGDPAQVELHDPLAYFADGRLRLEAGSRLAARRFCPPPATGSEQWPRYSMRFEVEASSGTTLLAEDYLPEHAAVPLPDIVRGTIRVTVHQQNCIGSFGFPQRTLCGPKEVRSTQEYPMLLRGLGDHCKVIFGRSLDQVYAVDDRDPDDYVVEQIANFELYADSYYDAGTEPQLEVEGYFVGNAGQQPTSFPNVNPLEVGDHFSLHNTDFYPVFGPITAWERLALVRSQGVDHAAGLRWPRIRGQLNGLPYAYSCGLPKVVRDAVNLCPGAEDPANIELDHAYYRLPFEEGDRNWTQGQGNKSGGTHGQGFAYDMVAPLDQRILVARAGRVEDLKESATEQCTEANEDTCERGNFLYVRHQDGSIGQYTHMPENGVTPTLGQLVRRGDEVGRVGLTGNTSGPHLHFAAREDVPGSGPTKLALFEVIDPSDETQLIVCHEPQNRSGETLLSNNVPR
jgi:hypothetical protein